MRVLPYPNFKSVSNQRMQALVMLFAGSLMAGLGGLMAFRTAKRGWVLVQDSAMQVLPTEPAFLLACALISITLMLAGGTVLRSAFRLSAAERLARRLELAETQANRLLERLPNLDIMAKQAEARAEEDGAKDQARHAA